MKRRSTCLSLVVCLILCSLVLAKSKKNLMLVQLYGESMTFPNKNLASYEVFLIMPDGTHVRAICLSPVSSPSASCHAIEPSTIERRVKVACDEIRKENRPMGLSCFRSESYWAERKINDITLGAANGSVTYHVISSW